MHTKPPRFNVCAFLRASSQAGSCCPFKAMWSLTGAGNGVAAVNRFHSGGDAAASGEDSVAELLLTESVELAERRATRSSTKVKRPRHTEQLGGTEDADGLRECAGGGGASKSRKSSTTAMAAAIAETVVVHARIYSWTVAYSPN